MRSFISHAAAAYLGAGLFSAYVIMSAVPATTILGGMYHMVTWPGAAFCATRSCLAPVERVPVWALPYFFDTKSP